MPLPWWVYTVLVVGWVVVPLLWRLLGPLLREVWRHQVEMRRAQRR